MDEQSLRETICEVGRRLYEKDLVGGAEGNVSARLGPNRLIATPSGLCKGHLKPEDMVVIDSKGAPVDGGTPSSEIKMHLRLYERRQDCMAVVHAHPLTATGLALGGYEFPDNLLPEAAYVLGPIAKLPFAMPGTDEVPDGLDPFIEGHKTFLLMNHGAVVMGKDLFDALYRMETLERVSKILLVAEVSGSPQGVPEGHLQVILASGLHGRF